MDDYHLLIASKVINRSAQLGRPLDYIEVGVLTGNSAKAVLSTGKVKSAVLVDSFSDPTYDSFQSSPELVARNLAAYEGKFRILKGDSKVVLPRLNGTDQFDVGFVDGDHSISGCYADMNNMLPLLRSEGIMFVDDMGFGIGRTVEEFAKSHELQFTYHDVHNGLGELGKTA